MIQEIQQLIKKLMVLLLNLQGLIIELINFMILILSTKDKTIDIPYNNSCMI